MTTLSVLLITGAASAKEEKKGGFMDKLTEEQKACVDGFNCPKIEFKKGEEKPEGMEEARECIKKAFESCGVEMPEKKMEMEMPKDKDGKKWFKKKSKE